MGILLPRRGITGHAIFMGKISRIISPTKVSGLWMNFLESLEMCLFMNFL